MRKRWKITDGFLTALIAVWVFGWIPVFIPIWATTTPCDRKGCGLHAEGAGWIPAKIFLAIYFGIVVIPAVTIGLVRLARLLWRVRPQRVVEPVTEDLRQARR